MEQSIEQIRERAEGHPTRKVMLELLDGAELSTRELGALLPGEVGLTTVVYHLSVLRDADLVAAPIGGLYRRLEA